METRSLSISPQSAFMLLDICEEWWLGLHLSKRFFWVMSESIVCFHSPSIIHHPVPAQQGLLWIRDTIHPWGGRFSPFLLGSHPSVSILRMPRTGLPSLRKAESFLISFPAWTYPSVTCPFSSSSRVPVAVLYDPKPPALYFLGLSPAFWAACGCSITIYVQQVNICLSL